MKIYNELAIARMNSTSALLVSLPQTFTSKEFNVIREKMARKNSGMTRTSLRCLPRAHVPYSLDGLREIGVIVTAFTEPIQIKVETQINEVLVRATGESLFIGTDAECEEFLDDDWWRYAEIRCKGIETREITVRCHHYSVDYEAYQTYIRETFGKF